MQESIQKMIKIDTDKMKNSSQTSDNSIED